MNHIQELKQLFDEGIIDEVSIFISSHDVKQTGTIDLLAKEVDLVIRSTNIEKIFGKMIESIKSEKKRLNL